MPLITPFDPWQNCLCSCPEKYSLAPYVGCGHHCLYCYASSYIPEFFRPRPKKDFLPRLAKEIIKIKPGALLAIANSCDCYQPLEKQHKQMREALKIIARHPVKVNIVTKSDLIARDRDIIKDLPATAAITVTTLDPELSARLEPGAPGPEQRLKAIERLSRKTPVALRLDPLIFGINTDSIEKIIAAGAGAGARQVIVSTYKMRRDNFIRMCDKFPEYKSLWIKMYKLNGDKKGPDTYLDKNRRRQIILNAKAVSQKYKLLFASCREGLSGLNSALCDGSGLL